MSKTYQIAVLAGDGIGKEVMPEGLRATMAAAKRFGLDLQLHTLNGPAATITPSTAR